MNSQNRTQFFPPELRTASIVPRWSIVWTLTRDTVANHSYYVTIYARKIAQLLGWSGNWGALMFLALVHDLDETITGDMVSPIKSEILDADRAAEYIEMKMMERLPDIAQEIHAIADWDDNPAKEKMVDDCWRIIKAADRLDALLFLIGERRMGNGVVEPRIVDAQARCHSAWLELPASSEVLQELWQTVMLPAIANHDSQGGHGV
jgi:5'-deoxynucleotidase YfbR-like HD superfamily hydrolase